MHFLFSVYVFPHATQGFSLMFLFHSDLVYLKDQLVTSNGAKDSIMQYGVITFYRYIDIINHLFTKLN